MEERKGAFDFREERTELFEERHALVDGDRAAKVVGDSLGQVGDAVFALLKVSLELPVVCHTRVVQLVHQPVNPLLSQPRCTMVAVMFPHVTSIVCQCVPSIGKNVSHTKLFCCFFFFSVSCVREEGGRRGKDEAERRERKAKKKTKSTREQKMPTVFFVLLIVLEGREGKGREGRKTNQSFGSQ